MKILMIHNFHRKGSASGDDQVYENEAALLEDHWNEVVRYTVSNDTFDRAGILGKLQIALGMLWSFRHYREVGNLIRRERPDIVHIHTFFPLLSPSVLYAAKRAGCRVAATLHDTRFICPCATSLREGKLCSACGDGHYLRMCRYRCFKGSGIQSLMVALIFRYHRMRKSFYRQIDRYICLNDSQASLLRRIGFDGKKIVKKYNYVPDAAAEDSTPDFDGIPDRYAVYYGRLGEEKGTGMLMDMWEKLPDIPLVVMGSGPMEKVFSEWAASRSQVYYLGYVQHARCLGIVKKGEFVVFPSIWYEGCSMVEIETESLGIPLIATDLGFSSEAIEEGVNGCKIPLGDVNGFAEKIRFLWENPALCKEMGRNARRDYEQKYMPEDNYRQLMEIYKRLQDEKF